MLPVLCGSRLKNVYYIAALDFQQISRHNGCRAANLRAAGYHSPGALFFGEGVTSAQANDKHTQKRPRRLLHTALPTTKDSPPSE